MALLPSSLFRDTLVVDAAVSSETSVNFGFTPCSGFSPHVYCENRKKHVNGTTWQNKEFLYIEANACRQTDRLSTCAHMLLTVFLRTLIKYNVLHYYVYFEKIWAVKIVTAAIVLLYVYVLLP
jgi:hypothetical protein